MVPWPQSSIFVAIAGSSYIQLYNLNTHFFISTLSYGESSPSRALAFSPDCTHLAIGGTDGIVALWDIRDIDASGPSSKGFRGNATPVPVRVLALSRDCSRLACGFMDGTIELWDTSHTKRRFASKTCKEWVTALVFSPDGRVFAFGLSNGTIQLWDGGDGSLRGTLEAPNGLRAVALSNSMLVATGNGDTTLWSLDTLSLTHSFTGSKYGTSTVSIAENNTLIAVAHGLDVSLIDAVNHRTILTFKLPHEIHTMTFLPNDLQLVTQSKEGFFLSFNLINKHIVEGTTLEHIIQFPNISLWHGVPIWHCLDEEQHYFTALFSQHKSPVPVLWIPRHIPVTAWAQGSSMMVLGCIDGRVILVRLPTSHVG